MFFFAAFLSGYFYFLTSSPRDRVDQTQNTVSIHGDLTQTLGDVETFADFNTRRRRSAEENSVAESVIKEISDGFRVGDGRPMTPPPS